MPGRRPGGLLAFGLSDNQESEEFQLPPELIAPDNGLLRTIYIAGGVIVAAVVFSSLFIWKKKIGIKTG